MPGAAFTKEGGRDGEERITVLLKREVLQERSFADNSQKEIWRNQLNLRQRALGSNMRTKEFDVGSKTLEEVSRHCGITLAVEAVGPSGSELRCGPLFPTPLDGCPATCPFSVRSFDDPSMIT